MGALDDVGVVLDQQDAVARVDEAAEHVGPSRDRPLAGPPGRSHQLVVQGDDAEGAGRSVAQRGCRPVELCVADPSGLVPPRPNRVQPDDVQRVRGVDRLRRLPEALEVVPRRREPTRRKERNVVVSRYDEHGRAEPAEELRDRVVLRREAAVGEVAARHDEGRIDTLDQFGDGVLESGIMQCAPRADVEIGHVEDARRHRRSRLQCPR